MLKMHAIKENHRNIDGKQITTYTRENVHSVQIEAGTTNGSWGDSTTTYLRLDPGENSPMNFEVKLTNYKYTVMPKVEVFAFGDWERDTLITAMEFMLQVLKDGREQKEGD